MNTMPSKGARSQGFTLIEIIAVIVIIGLMASIISVSMTNRTGTSATRKEAQLFLQAIDFVSEQSVLNNEIIGMFVEHKDTEDSAIKQWCYHWQRFRDGEWQDLPADTLSEHCLPEDMQWDLSVEGHEYAYEPELETQPPALVWSPSGEATPIEMKFFESEIRRAASDIKSEVQHIEIDMMGNSHWLEQEEENERNASKKR